MTTEEIKKKLNDRDIYIHSTKQIKSTTYFISPIPFFSNHELKLIDEVISTVEQYYIEYVDGNMCISINNKYLN